MMRYTQAEKMEIINLVEASDLSIRRTLQELDIPRSTFYRWYQRYQRQGYEGLANQSHAALRFWNKIPQQVKDEVVELALAEPEKSPRELAWQFTDEHEYYISESSVYRILRQFDLVTSPVYQMIPAKDKFERPTRRVNEMWQTDFTYFKVLGWGWYYLCTVLDDYSRYILAWRLAPTMAATDVQETLDQAFARTNLTHIKVRHRPRLLSDNGPGFIADELKSYLQRYRIEHVRSAPYHPMTQGKIERFHRSMKNVIKLENYYLPWHLEQAIKEFINYYNHQRYHESLDNVTPADMYHGRAPQIQSRRAQVKEKTMRERRRFNRRRTTDLLSYGSESLS